MLVQAHDIPRLCMGQAGSTQEEVVGDESLRKLLGTHSCINTPRLLVPRRQGEHSRRRVDRYSFVVPDEKLRARPHVCRRFLWDRVRRVCLARVRSKIGRAS
jgi:hypothetical protein